MPTKGKVVSKCALCGKVRELRNSHIIPAWAHKLTLSRERGQRSPHPLVVAKGSATLKSEPLREHLLCGGCEHEFSKREAYVSTIAYQPNGKTPFEKLLSDRRGTVADVPGLDAEAVTYLAVSIAWRAHVCTKLHKSTLGNYAEPCRLYLLGAAFPRDVYVALRFFEYRTNTIRRRLPVGRVIVDPQMVRDGRMRAHYFVFGGFSFGVGVGANPSREFREMCLHNSATKRVRVVDPYEVGFIASGREALRPAVPLGEGAQRVLGRSGRAPGSAPDGKGRRAW